MLWNTLACQSLGGTRPIALKARWQDRVEAVIHSVDAHNHVGVQVVSVRTGATVYEYNAQQHFTPASVLKLLTGAAALYYLGPTYRFTTDVLADEMERGGKVVKNLILRGSGDPGLTDNDLTAMALALKQQGITAITGDLVVDDTVFDSVPWGKGWMWDDLADGYSAPVYGVNVLHNEIAVTLLPGSRLGDPARVYSQPMSNVIPVQSSVVTGVAGGVSAVRVNAGNPENAGLLPGQSIVLAGTLPLDSAWGRHFAVRDGALEAGALLREHLKAVRIEVAGGVRRGVTPPTASVLASHTSRELSHALIDYMKASNNHGMECLLKRLGATTALAPGGWQNGLQAVRNFLAQQVGMDVATIKIADGSGGSRYSLVTPTQLTAVLRFMLRSFSLGPEFVASLPIGGLDGTLAGRFEVPLLHSRVRAKTGTMTGVSNLAGYLDQGDGEVFAFAIMMEGFTGGAGEYRRLQEEILLGLAR